MKKPSRSRLYAIHRGFFEGFNQFELLNVEELEEIHLRFLKLNFTEPPNGSTGQNRSLAEVVTKKRGEEAYATQTPTLMDLYCNSPPVVHPAS